MASARPKEEREISKDWDKEGKKTPKLCRTPMAMINMNIPRPMILYIKKFDFSFESVESVCLAVLIAVLLVLIIAPFDSFL